MDDLISIIIKAAYNVHNELGTGFLEKVYQNAMLIELKSLGLDAENETPIDVFYKKHVVGEYYADIIVNDMIVLEFKAVENLDKIHEVQLVNYLKGTGIEIGLLINFGSSVQVKKKYRTFIKRQELQD
jgi:GxxExxY protein